jgi:RNA polymerase sigma factor (sigma-70 family)
VNRMSTDVDLLSDYLSGEEDAFAALVHRHGAMVFGVCSRVLGSRHDAEDAFQAVFIVLARRAADVRPPEQLSRWLYGVARRTALKARDRRTRRGVVEALAGESGRPARPAPELPTDLWRVLDQEVVRLPGRLLSPFVLCDLEGRTYREAARQLGVPEGTLSNRLAAARRLLAGWLTRRGVVLPAAGLAPALVPARAHAVSAELLASTADAVGSSSPLADGVLQTMTATKAAKAVAAVLVLVGLAWGGWGAWSVLDRDPELRSLEGEWTVVAAERSGKPVTADELKTMSVSISGDTLTLRGVGQAESVQVKVDAETTPKGIVLFPLRQTGGRPEMGIYELDGTRLRVCWGEAPGAGGRPAEFKTSAAGGGRLLVLEKAK